MSPTNTNGHSGHAPIATALERPKPANLPVLEAKAIRVVELATDVVHTPPDNLIDMQAVEELRANMGEHGQLVECIVYLHSDLPGHYWCADGNHRLTALRLLGRPIRARVLDKIPDEAELITLRVTTATIGKTADSSAIAADIYRWMEITGADQSQATAHFGYKSQSAISKLLVPYKNGVEELLAALKERRIAATAAYLVAALPKEMLPQVLGKKRDAVLRIVQLAKGAKPKRVKAVKLVCGDVVASVKGDTVAALKAFLVKAAEAIKKLEREKLPPEYLGGLMQ